MLFSKFEFGRKVLGPRSMGLAGDIKTARTGSDHPVVSALASTIRVEFHSGYCSIICIKSQISEHGQRAFLSVTILAAFSFDSQ